MPTKQDLEKVIESLQKENLNLKAGLVEMKKAKEISLELDGFNLHRTDDGRLYITIDPSELAAQIEVDHCEGRSMITFLKTWLEETEGVE